MSKSDSRLEILYRDYVERHDTAAFVEEVNRYYTQATLLRLGLSSSVTARRAVALALGFLGDYEANAVFGRLLCDTDRCVRLLAENGIKNIWTRYGDPMQRHALRRIMRRIAADDFDEAIRCANILVEEVPQFAEARNQRSIALFGLKRFEDAIEDAAVVLEINPYHFGACLGIGHAYLQIGEPFLAICSFHHALKINPNLEAARLQIAKIERRLRLEDP